MNRSHLRKQIVACLQAGNFQSLKELAGREPAVAGILMQFLYNPRDLMHWRAIEGLGQVAASHPGQVQKLINRLLWLLNEDSGSFGWGSAAALGEIGRHRISLVQEIIPMFIGFLEAEFSRGPMLWGLGRLGEVHPELLAEIRPIIVQFLTSPEPEIRAMAAWSLGKIRLNQAAENLRAMVSDEAPVKIYDRGEFVSTTVGQVALRALRSLHKEVEEAKEAVTP